METKEIISYLKQNEIKNCNMVYFIEDNEITFLKKCGDAVIAKGISDRPWVYFSSNNDVEFDELLNLTTGEDKSFAVVNDRELNILSGRFKIEIELSTQKLYLPSNVSIKDVSTQIFPLRLSDAIFIYENSDYQEFIPIDYVERRIEKGISAAIYHEGNPVAWSITHDDGAIGFLYVLPVYRGKGMAEDITSRMINMVRQSGRIPFAHVEDSNTASMGLVNRLGFVNLEHIHWVRRIAE